MSRRCSDSPLLLALLQQDLDLVLGVHLQGRRGLDAEQPQHAVGRPPQDLHRGEGDVVEGGDGQDRDQGVALRVAHGHELGHQLPEEDVQPGDQQEGHHEGQGGGDPRDRDPVQQREQAVDQPGHGGLPHPAQPQAGHGDAQLHRGHEAVEVVHREADEPRPVPALAGELLQAALADAHQRVLGHGEEAIRRDQQDGDEQIYQVHGTPSG
jgi:hypothetical protein